MGRRCIKKYTIHILAVPALQPGVFDLPPERNAVIICTGRTNSYIDNYIKKNKLVLNFPDYEDPGLVGSFNGAHARVIIRFVRSLPKTVTDVYVCCSKGGSRSAAVAAALLRMSERWQIIE